MGFLPSPTHSQLLSQRPGVEEATVELAALLGVWGGWGVNPCVTWAPAHLGPWAQCPPEQQHLPHGSWLAVGN